MALEVPLEVEVEGAATAAVLPEARRGATLDNSLTSLSCNVQASWVIGSCRGVIVIPRVWLFGSCVITLQRSATHRIQN